MYKLGICQAQDIGFRRTRFSTYKHMTYALLRVPMPPTPAGIEQFETVIKTVKLSSGVSRTTYRGRFRDVDTLVTNLLQRQFSGSDQFKLWDWGSSDGVSVLEWTERVWPLFPGASFVASDLVLNLWLAKRRPSEYFVFQPDLSPLQFVHPPFVIPLTHPESPVYLINTLLRWYGNWKFAQLRPELSRLSLLEDSFLVGAASQRLDVEPISLIHPKVQEALLYSTQFSFERHDAFSEISIPCDVLRVMNLFNLGYFPEPVISAGIQCAWKSLKLGGIWIVGRTEEGAHRMNHVTVFQKTPAGWVVSSRLGQGSEIEKLALAFNDSF